MAKKSESDFVPNPTDIGGTLDTSGTAHGGQYERLEDVTDVFNSEHVEKADKLAAERAEEHDALVAQTDYTVTGESPDTTSGGAQGSVHGGTGARKRSAKKTPAKKTGATKRAAKKAPAKKTAAKKAAPAKRAAVKQAAPAAKTGSQRRAAKKG